MNWAQLQEALYQQLHWVNFTIGWYAACYAMAALVVLASIAAGAVFGIFRLSRRVNHT